MTEDQKDREKLAQLLASLTPQQLYELSVMADEDEYFADHLIGAAHLLRLRKQKDGASGK